ncbi:NAD(P)-dependent oxidoreductase [Pelagibius sp.]|uniref:NAD-dependent epimerase/dehydratase family protein n=1 Tax=Pelagibius sp. TaxID=1931238 RepID=UPI00262E4CED|nr:NAD-dependent epimerase/dehydratase family protein [Pelagibius sp.]
MTSQTPQAGTVALTGATGFVGGHIARRLAAGGWRVRALVRRPLQDSALGDLGELVTPVQGALDSPAALSELVAGADAVVHCAGLVAARRRSEFHAVNGIGTARLAEAAAAAPGAPRFLLISSLAAREPGLSPYAASKREAEDLLRRKAEGLSWQVLRPPVVYGPGDRATLDLFRQFARGFALIPGGAGRFSMIYVEDLAAAVEALLQASPPEPHIIELDDARPGGYAWADVVAAAERQLGRRVRSLAVPGPLLRLVAGISSGMAMLTGRASVLSQGKVNEIAHPDWVCRSNLLGDLVPWRPLVAFEEGFSRTLAWYKAAGWL